MNQCMAESDGEENQSSTQRQQPNDRGRNRLAAVLVVVGGIVVAVGIVLAPEITVPALILGGGAAVSNQ